VIQGFACKDTEELFHYQHSRRFRAFERIALRNCCNCTLPQSCAFLRRLLENHLEALREKEKGNTRYGLTISGESVCLADGHCHEVEIVDYH